MTQTASCRDCGLRPIVRISRGAQVVYYTDLLDAYYVTAYLACGHRRDVVMSIHNIEAVRDAAALPERLARQSREALP